MCSPTKIGEYLAAGLHIIGLQGINVLDRLAKSNSCADLINAEYFEGEIVNLNFNGEKIAKNILSRKRQKRSRDTAEQIYSLKKANENYYGLYKELEF